MSDDFKDHPKTIGEIRTDKTLNAKDWTPREALISLLRQIDAGEVAPTRLIIAHGYIENGATKVTATRAGTLNSWESLGLLEEARDAFLKNE